MQNETKVCENWHYCIKCFIFSRKNKTRKVWLRKKTTKNLYDYLLTHSSSTQAISKDPSFFPPLMTFSFLLGVAVEGKAEKTRMRQRGMWRWMASGFPTRPVVCYITVRTETRSIHSFVGQPGYFNARTDGEPRVKSQKFNPCRCK